MTPDITRIDAAGTKDGIMRNVFGHFREHVWKSQKVCSPPLMAVCFPG